MKDLNLSVGGARPVGGADLVRGRESAGNIGSSQEFRSKLEALRNIPTAPANVSPTGGLKFSNHAVDRMQARGIRFSPEDLLKIESAVQKAASKGAKDTLLLTDSSAMIVSVKDNTVVTVMDKSALKENVFTNIDSTVMI